MMNKKVIIDDAKTILQSHACIFERKRTIFILSLSFANVSLKSGIIMPQNENQLPDKYENSGFSYQLQFPYQQL